MIHDLQYCKYAVFPQIPYTQDILYMLQLSNQKDSHGYYSIDGAANWSTYIENMIIVAANCASEIFNMERYNEPKAKRIIAETIIGLCPENAKCLFHNAFVSAQEVLIGGAAPSRKFNREEILLVCNCPGCKEIRKREGFCDIDSIM